jgi:two-component system catabolic regulation response regulator CreB
MDKPAILIIEDEPSVADNISYALSTEGYEPLWRNTGKDGLTALEETQVDLVILDIGLPDVNGFDLCRQIRELSRVPIIFLTARGEEIDRIAGLEMGGDDYMTKPFSPRELTARVRAILRRTQNQREEPPAANSYGPFEVDSERLAIRYQGEALSLTRYEYRLLELFIRRPGRVFSRDMLMEQVWEEPDASMDRTVDAHIKSLRAKMRSIQPDDDPIQTHRGTGYALKEYP